MTTEERATAVATAVGRWPATLVFFLNGLAMSTFIVLMPALKVSLNLSDGQLGIIGMTFAMSALTAMQFVGALVSRVGTAPVLRTSLALLPLLLALVGLADGMAGLILAAVAFGVVHGATDAAMNAHAVAVERRLGRAILNGCHAAWSISAVVASLTAATLAQAGVPVAIRAAGVSAVLLAAGLVLGRFLVSSTVDKRDAATARTDRGWRGGWSRPIVALGLTGMALMVFEGAALAWAAVLVVAISGFAVAGIGGSVLVPLVFSSVGHLAPSGAGPAVAISRLTTFTYAGVLLGPGIIGASAELAGLPATMTALVPLLLVVAVLTRLPRSERVVS